MCKLQSREELVQCQSPVNEREKISNNYNSPTVMDKEETSVCTLQSREELVREKMCTQGNIS